MSVALTLVTRENVEQALLALPDLLRRLARCAGIRFLHNRTARRSVFVSIDCEFSGCRADFPHRVSSLRRVAEISRGVCALTRIHVGANVQAGTRSTNIEERYM